MNQFRKQVNINPTHQSMTNKVQVGETRDIGRDLQGLLSFAGSAASTVTTYLNEKVEKDKVLQAARVAAGELPSEDATKGGYDAAAALGISLESAKREARLQAFAATNPDDESWEAELLKETDLSKKFLLEKFPKAADNPDLQSLIAMDSIDAMPSLVKTREVARLKQEQASRIADFGEVAISLADNPHIDFDGNIKAVAQQLKLDPSTAEKALVDSAVQSGNINLLDRMANMKVGKSGLTLGQKNVRINDALTQARAKEARKNAATMAAEVVEINNQLQAGQMSPKQFVEFVNTRNEATGGSFMSQSQVESNLSRVARESGMKNYISGLANSVVTGSINSNLLSKADKQAVSDQVFNTTYQDALNELPDDERKSIEGQTKALNNTTASTAQKLAESGIVSDKIKQSVNSIINVDVDDVITTNKEGIESINPNTQASLNMYQSIPENLRFMYAKGEQAQMLNEYVASVNKGISPPVALRQAQMKKWNVTLTGKKYEAADEVLGSVMRPWFSRDVSNSNENYWLDKIQKYQSSFIDPSSDDSFKSTKRFLEDNTTRLDDGNYVMGNPQYLLKGMGFNHQNPATVSSAIENYKSVHSDAIKRASEIYGFNEDEAIVDINMETGKALLLAPNGVPILASSSNLEDIGKRYRETYYRKLRASNGNKDTIKAVMAAGPVSLSSRLYSKGV